MCKIDSIFLQMFIVTKRIRVFNHSFRYYSSLENISNDSACLDMSKYQDEYIRNFCIIAHVDHGKSTLADRLLEYTGAISKEQKLTQVLDTLQVERARGITVKAQAVSLFYKFRNKEYLLNLIDTPGHVDFSYEVNRSLAACQGALLLIDATQGVQAQTIANYWAARNQGIQTILPVLNKIDLPNSDIPTVIEQMKQANLPTNHLTFVSAKNGTNIENELFPKIITTLSHPICKSSNITRALLFDSWYDQYKGVVCLIAIMDGSLKTGQILTSFATKKSYQIQSLGIHTPSRFKTNGLYFGQVGWIILGMKEPSEAMIGDTLYSNSSIEYIEPENIIPLPGFRKPRPMVFSGVFPSQLSEYSDLKEAIDRLCLNDSSITLSPSSSTILGRGWRIGFLGTLHMDVFKQRLEQEYDAIVIFTAPTIPYLLCEENTEKLLLNASEELSSYITKSHILKEPWIKASIATPSEHVGSLMRLCTEYRGEQVSMQYPTFESDRIIMIYLFPLSEIVYDFYNQLKEVTSGYASLDYHSDKDDVIWKPCKVELVQLFINDKLVPDLSFIAHPSKAQAMGRALLSRLKDHIDRQVFEVVLQAKIGIDEKGKGGRVIARESISPSRKDVTAKCYGGDKTRKMKLLEHQKESKKKLKMIGRVELQHEAFLSLMTISKNKS